MIVQQSDRQRAEVDGPEPVVLWHQAGWLAPQGEEIDPFLRRGKVRACPV